MFTVALTGGIGSGKSTVADILEELGALVIDSDLLAREVIERGTNGYDQVVARFGDSILRDGEIDRSALGNIVFSDVAARKDLEGIIHPLVRERAEKIASRAGDRVVINQIPLLFETKGSERFDFVISVEADEEIRKKRLRERGLKDYEINKRMAAQASDIQRASIADVVITNNGTIDDLTRKIEALWESELFPKVGK
ncbi:MAG: dephospho-CoA kinase, long form [Actinomycetales bacterium]|nr:dephospho-CoA kinase, long form [Actinomycetales bacterium]